MAATPLRDLVRLAGSSETKDRNRLAESLATLLLASGRTLGLREQDLVYDILRQIIHEVEMRVRRVLADRIAARQNAPRDLVATLANDVIEVAYPVLVNSPVLEDEDLIALILEHTARHQIAITKRADLSPAVSNQLAETGDPVVIRSLLENEGAAIGAETYARLVDWSQSMTDIQTPLAMRADLPPALAERMAGWVGEAIRTYLEDKMPDAGDSVVDDAVAEVVQSKPVAVEVALAEPAGPEDGKGYLPHPRVLVRALENGDIFRFEEAFRDYTGLSEAGVTRLLYDAGVEALAIACKGSGIDRYAFSDILCNLHGAGNVKGYRETPAYLKTMDYFERIKADGARQVLEAWRKAEDAA